MYIATIIYKGAEIGGGQGEYKSFAIEEAILDARFSYGKEAFEAAQADEENFNIEITASKEKAQKKEQKYIARLEAKIKELKETNKDFSKGCGLIKDLISVTTEISNIETLKNTLKEIAVTCTLLINLAEGK